MMLKCVLNVFYVSAALQRTKVNAVERRMDDTPDCGCAVSPRVWDRWLRQFEKQILQENNAKKT